jgi:hypothetical protein
MKKILKKLKDKVVLKALAVAVLGILVLLELLPQEMADKIEDIVEILLTLIG